MRPSIALAAVLIGALTGGCRTPLDAGAGDASDAGGKVAIAPNGKVLEAAENEGASKDGGAAKAKAALAASQRIDIPSGAFIGGSTPGDEGRDPVLEPALLGVELGAFAIDRAPYPNDPSKAPLTGVTRQKAADLCAEAGARLCTELEWERACKGPEGSLYAGGSTWDPSCAKAPMTCASGFDVLSMGAALREWTASDVAPIEHMQPKSAAVRGAAANAVAIDHRCAHRSAIDASAKGDDLGFRCCRGAPNAASIPSPEWQQTFRRVELPIAKVVEMFASVPQLAALGTELNYFNEASATQTVLSRGDAGEPPKNTTLTTSPLMWNPVPGEELLILAVQGAKDSAIVAFHRLPDERYRVGSTLVMKGERGPIVIGFNGFVRRRLAWSTCWDCRGESGNLTYRDDNRVVITQK